MRARDSMSTNFRVVEATWSPAYAREMIERGTAAFIVVRRQNETDRMYYVYRREEILRTLEAAHAGDLGKALDLGDAGAAEIVQPDETPRKSAARLVVVAGQRPVGVIVPVRRTRGMPDNVPMTAIQAPEAEPPARYLSAELPSSVTAGANVSLTVSLSMVAQEGSASVSIAQPAGTKIQVLVEPSEGLLLAGSALGVLEVTDPQPDVVIQFKLKAGDVGIGRVRVYVFCGGTSIADLKLTTSIVAAGSPQRPAEVRERARIDAAPRPLPDLSMYIFERGGELSFRLQSADGRYHMTEFGPIKMQSSPQQHFRTFFRDIENLPIDTPEQRKSVQRRLEAKGANLFELVFPKELKLLLWELRERIDTVQITSDEPWIPWEMCRLTGTTEGRADEGRFFAEAFSVTRWLYGVGAPREIPLGNVALVVPGDSQLSHAPAEKGFVMSLASDQRKVREVNATYLDVTDAMATGAFDAWHFTGHARADQGGDADQSAIELVHRETLKPEDVIGQVENVLLPRPFVFLNACQSAQAGLSLTGVGGWAQRFLRPGTSDRTASAFVGSYWSVYDDAAFDFARELYQGLLGGKPIGQAARDARLAIRKPEDSTWLAYTVYADPHAAVKT